MTYHTKQDGSQQRSSEWKNYLSESLVKSYKNSPFPSTKITSYFPAYAELFGHLVNTKCVFIETGILDGGSIFMWREWLGPQARIVGIDLNPEASKWREHGFEIFIGDQGDPEFWESTLSEIGNFDALLIDGGHQSFQQIVTTIEAIKYASNDCVIVVEDTATSFMKDFSAHGSFSFLEYAKDATDILIGRSFEMYANRFPKKINTEAINEFRNVYSIQFYNGIAAFHLNQKYSKVPELVKNHPPAGASDFRYEGKNKRQIKLADTIAEKKIVEVYGGENQRSKIVKSFSSLLPTKMKSAIKLAKVIRNPKAAIARLATKYLNFYNGFSYDFKKNGEEELILKFRMFDPKIVFDVGANVGEWTKVALGSLPSSNIHSFEISKSTFKSLNNNVKSGQVRLNNIGLAAENGSFSYKDYGENSGVNTILLTSDYHDARYKPKLITAQLRRGDAYCDENGINFIDFLKIDVEGAEHLVLFGFEKMLTKKAVRLIQFEYGYTNGDTKFLMRDFYEYFEKLGYIIGRVRKGSIYFDQFHYSHNDFNSGPNYVAIRADDLKLRDILSKPTPPQP